MSHSTQGLLCCAPAYPTAHEAPTTSQQSSPPAASVWSPDHRCCLPSCGIVSQPECCTSDLVSLRLKQVAASASGAGWLELDDLEARALIREVFLAKGEPGQAAGLAAQS